MSDNNRRWKTTLVEAAAIVASILLAFAIDAWWDNVKADAKTQEILVAVQFEVESNLVSLRESIERHSGIVDAIETMREHESINGLLTPAVIDVDVFEPNTGALDTLIATGMLGEIDDAALQISLSAFAGLANDLNERESRAVAFRDAARRRIAAIGEPIWKGISSERVEADIHVLNLLMMRRSEELAAIDSARRLEAHLAKLLLQLEASN